MRAFLKFLAAALAAALLGLGGLTVYIKVKFPPERLKALAAEQVKIHLNREMRLENASIGLVGGLSLEGFALSERPDFAAGTFVSGRRLAVKPYLLPLLRGNIVIKSVDLAGPAFRVVRYADGRFNFSDLAGSSPDDRPPKSGAPVSLFVDHVRIDGGAAAFEDRSPAKIHLSVEDLALSIDSFSFLTPFRISLSARARGLVREKPLAGDVKFTGSVGLFGGGEAAIRELSVTVLKTALSAQGSVKNFSDPRADLRLTIKSFDPASVAPFFTLPGALSDAQVSGDLTIKGGLPRAEAAGTLKVAAAGIKTDLSLEAAAQDLTGNLSFDASVGFANLAAAGGAAVGGLEMNGPADGKVRAKGTAKTMSVELSLDLDKAALRYGALASKPAGDALRISARAELKEPFTDPAFQAEGRAAKLSLGSGAPLPADLKMNGPAAVSFSAQGTLDDLDIAFDFDGKGADIAYADYLAKPAGAAFVLKIAARVKDQKIVDITSGQGTLGAMNFSARGPLGNVTAEGNMNVSIQAPTFDVGPAAGMIPMLRDYKLSGKAGLNAVLRGSFLGPQAGGTASLKGLDAVPREGLDFKDLSGDVAFTLDSAATKNLKGKFNGADMALKAEIRHFDAPDLWLDGELARLDAARIMALFAEPAAPPAPVKKSGAPSLFLGVAHAAEPAAPAGFRLARTHGTFRVGIVSHPNYLGKNFRLTWDLADVDAAMDRCGGTADFTAADGKIHDLPLAAKINKVLRRDAADLSYDKISGRFTITRGVLETRDFAVNASYADILARGSVSLVDLRSDMRAILKLPRGSVGGSVGDAFTDDDGRPTIEATLRGPISDPAIAVDLSKAARRAGEKLLKKLMGGEETPAPAPADSPAPAPAAEKSPEQQLKEQGLKALEKLFKRK